MTEKVCHILDRDDATVRIAAEGDGFVAVTSDGIERPFELEREGGRLVLRLADGTVRTAFAHRLDSEHVQVHLDGTTTIVRLLDERALRRRASGASGAGDDGPEVKSPMAGRIVATKVVAGDEVAAGETLLIVEAMKMENDIKAARDGVVADVLVAAGDAVEVGTLLLRFADDTN